MGVNAIFKFPVAIGHEYEVEMQIGARILDVQVQRGVPCIWAIVDPSRKKEKRRFCWVGTGHEHDSSVFAKMRHVGTVQDGALVFHLFEMCS